MVTLGYFDVYIDKDTRAIDLICNRIQYEAATIFAYNARLMRKRRVVRGVANSRGRSAADTRPREQPAYSDREGQSFIKATYD